jgi:ATP-dependent DNA helicase RecG
VFLRELKNPVRNIRGVGEVLEKTFAKKDIISVADLLLFEPKEYEDRSVILPLKDYYKQRKICVVVKVLEHRQFFFNGAQRWKIVIADGTMQAELTYYTAFNQCDKLLCGHLYKICGQFRKSKHGVVEAAFVDYEEYKEHEEIITINGNEKIITLPPSEKFGKILPVYYTDNKKNMNIRTVIFNAINQYGMHVENELPAFIIERHNLLSKKDAIRALHYPKTIHEKNDARRTLIYEVLFYLEIIIGKRALARKKVNDAGDRSGRAALTSSDSTYTILQQRLIERLPFALTAGQTMAIADINQDLESGFAAARLLQGDVGSGKTLVSFMAALNAVERGGQVALMAPTELLARQHAENAAHLLEPLGVRVAFLTGNIKTAGRNNLLKALGAGELDIVVGTHALFSRGIIYKNLSLVIIDEQHRFGVTQRQAIMAKGNNPDLFMMSATPIPRTLTFTLFGDMDVSIIQDMPPGRKEIKTIIKKESNVGQVYNVVREEIESGRQAYFVYPLIEANDDLDLKDAESMIQLLSKKIFPKFKCALIHSKLGEDQKRTIMDEFRCGGIQILVATSVVEVGVDVPNASCMVIEHAERFGLSALHQLRGRVGRGEAQSYCFLIYADQDVPDKYKFLNVDPQTLSEKEHSIMANRLITLRDNNNGFIIAEKDLQFRGGGQVAGTEQSGFARLGIADPVRDIEILKAAREDAFAILENDEELIFAEHQVIAEVLNRALPFNEVAL